MKQANVHKKLALRIAKFEADAKSSRVIEGQVESGGRSRPGSLRRR